MAIPLAASVSGRSIRILALSACLVGVCSLLSACKTAPQPTPAPLSEAEQERAMREQRLQYAWSRLELGDTNGAERALEPLRGIPELSRELRLFDREIEARRAEPALNREIQLSRDLAITEVRKGLVMPENYGQTRIISPTTGPFDLPQGPMEALINRPISLSLRNADVTDIVLELSKSDGLNIVADDALEAQRPLTINVKDVPLKEVLSYISRNMGITFYLGENMIWVTETTDPGTPGPTLETHIIRLRKGYIPGAFAGGGGGGGGGNSDDESFGDNFSSQSGDSADNDDLLQALTDFLQNNPDNPANADFKIYRNRNILVIRNSRENIRAAQSIVDAFDQTPQQVLIEARFLTITQDALFQLGTSINSLNYSTSSTTTNDFSSVLPAFANTIGGAPQLAFGGIIDNVTYNAVITALEQSGNTKTLSAPRVTVVNNQIARIRRGDVRLYFDEFEQESTGGDTPVVSIIPSGEAQELQLGITLQVQPSIGNDSRTITMSLDAQIRDFIENVQLSETIALPRTNENTLQTIVAVNSGQTIVMGGQLTDEENESEDKVPLLGDIPYVGYLFKKKERNKRPSHLLIFLKATVIDPDGHLNLLPDQVSPETRLVP